MRIGYYPGCSLLGTAREYDESLRAIAPRIGLELCDIPDWNCCGASAAHMLDRDLSVALAARVLALAEQAGHEELLVPCAACYNRLATVQYELRSDADLQRRITGIIEMDIHGSIKICNVLEIMERIFSNKNEERFRYRLEHAAACYYGCLLVRPPAILQFDNSEDPQSMDKIMKKIGAKPIDWAFKVECCGAGLSVSRTDIVARLSGKIITDAVTRGAEALVVACPMCHSNLDMRRRDIERFYGRKFTIPVLYITQAVGLALGCSPKELGLHRHFVPVKLDRKRLDEAAASTKPDAKPEEAQCHA